MNAIEPQTISTLDTGAAPRGAAPSPALTTGLAKTPQPESKLVRSMGTLPLDAPRRVAVHSTASRSLGLRGTLRAWWRRLNERRELAAMGERELQDIGITRAEAGHEVHKWFWQD